MKVQLKRNSRRYPDLTFGNVYRVIGIEAGDLRIMNDDGEPFLYSRALFTIIDASMPKIWQVKTGPDGETYAYPPELARPGFFEDYFERNRRAMATLQDCLARLHRSRPTPPSPVRRLRKSSVAA